MSSRFGRSYIFEIEMGNSILRKAMRVPVMQTSIENGLVDIRTMANSKRWPS
jgi:hypothetical protein